MSHRLADADRHPGLLADQPGDGIVDVGDILHGPADPFNGLVDVGGGRLNPIDMASGFGGGFGRLVGQCLDLPGDHGEPPARLTRTRRFDGGIDGQKMGLVGDGFDQRHDPADGSGGIGQGGRSAGHRFGP